LPKPSLYLKILVTREQLLMALFKVSVVCENALVRAQQGDK